jgi:hypothetical protein
MLISANFIAWHIFAKFIINRYAAGGDEWIPAIMWHTNVLMWYSECHVAKNRCFVSHQGKLLLPGYSIFDSSHFRKKSFCYFFLFSPDLSLLFRIPKIPCIKEAINGRIILMSNIRYMCKGIAYENSIRNTIRKLRVQGCSNGLDIKRPLFSIGFGRNYAQSRHSIRKISLWCAGVR